ncbi:MAG: hypothetical protein ACX932_06105 [Gammaproteobacteria bacterium]
MPANAQSQSSAVKKLFGKKLRHFVDRRIRNAAKAGNKKRLVQWLRVASMGAPDTHPWHWQLGTGINKEQSLISYLLDVAADRTLENIRLYEKYHANYEKKKAALLKKYAKNKWSQAKIEEKLNHLEKKLEKQLVSRRYLKQKMKAQDAFCRLKTVIEHVFTPHDVITEYKTTRFQRFIQWLCKTMAMPKSYYSSEVLKIHTNDVIMAFDDEENIATKAKSYEDSAKDILYQINDIDKANNKIKKIWRARRLIKSTNNVAKDMVKDFQRMPSEFARHTGLQTLEHEMSKPKRWLEKFIRIDEKLADHVTDKQDTVVHHLPKELAHWRKNLSADYIQQEEYVQEHLNENEMTVEQANVLHHCIDSSYLYDADHILNRVFSFAPNISPIGVSFDYDNCQRITMAYVDELLNEIEQEGHMDPSSSQYLNRMTSRYLKVGRYITPTSFCVSIMKKEKNEVNQSLSRKFLLALKESANICGYTLQISDNALAILKKYGGNCEKTYCYEYFTFLVKNFFSLHAFDKKIINDEPFFHQDYLPLGFATQIDKDNKTLNLLFSHSLRYNQLQNKNYPIGRDMVGGPDALPYIIGKFSPEFIHLDFDKDEGKNYGSFENSFHCYFENQINTPEEFVEKLHQSFKNGKSLESLISFFDNCFFDEERSNAIHIGLKNLSVDKKAALFSYYKDCVDNSAKCEFFVTSDNQLVPAMFEYSQGQWKFYNKQWIQRNILNTNNIMFESPHTIKVFSSFDPVRGFLYEKNINLSSSCSSKLDYLDKYFPAIKVVNSLKRCGLYFWLYCLVEEKKDIEENFFDKLINALYQLSLWKDETNGGWQLDREELALAVDYFFFANPEETVAECSYEFINFIEKLSTYTAFECQLFIALVSRPTNLDVTRHISPGPYFVVHANPGSCIETIRYVQHIIDYQREHSDFITPEFIIKLQALPFIEYRKKVISQRFEAYNKNKIENNELAPSDKTKASVAQHVFKQVRYQTDDADTMTVRRKKDNANKNEKYEKVVTVSELPAGAYDLSDCDRLLSRIKSRTRLKGDEKASLRNAIHLLNTYAEALMQQFGDKPQSLPTVQEEQALWERLFGKVKESWSEIEYLGYLRHHLYVHSDCHRWLRLEQVMSILLLFRYNALLQIHCSEGKTIINQMTALLLGALGKKVDVLTHAREYTLRDCDKTLAHLCGTLGLQAVHRYQAGVMAQEAEAIRRATIYYCDIYQAIHDEEGARFEGRSVRVADTVLLDEIDNMVIDIDSTTTIALATRFGEEGNPLSDEVFVEMLSALNRVTDELVRAMKMGGRLSSLATEAEQQAFIDKAMSSVEPRTLGQAYHDLDEAERHYWISAAMMAKPLRRGEDYVLTLQEGVRSEPQPPLEEKAEEAEVLIEDRDSMAVEIKTYGVDIMHKETSGRRDEHSHWGNGVHQMIALRERWLAAEAARRGDVTEKRQIVLPSLSARYADCDVRHYVKKYDHRCGVTGTLGNEEVLAIERKVIDAAVSGEGKPYFEGIIPRAKRRLVSHLHPEGAPSHWPWLQREQRRWASWYTRKEHFSDVYVNRHGESSLTVRYSRRYDYRAEVVPGNRHYARLAEGLLGAQKQRLSSLVFFKTVNDCESFNRYLQSQGISDVQILDDQKRDRSTNGEAPEAMLIENASRSGKITLTTAAGSRATDFHGIEVGFVAKPCTQRVLEQMLARLGRAGELAITYQIYSAEDVGLTSSLMKPHDYQEKIKTITSFEESLLQAQQKEKQQGALACLRGQYGLRKVKYELRQQAFANIPLMEQEEKATFQRAWCGFYAGVDELYTAAVNNGQSGEQAVREAYDKAGLQQEAKIMSLTPNLD